MISSSDISNCVMQAVHVENQYNVIRLFIKLWILFFEVIYFLNGFTCNFHWFVLVSFLSRCLWCSSLLLSSRERSRLNKPWCSSTSSNFSRYRPSISAANGERVTWKPCLPSTRKSDIGSMTTGRMGTVNIRFFLAGPVRKTFTFGIISLVKRGS